MFEITIHYWRASHSRENGQAWLPTARTRQVSTECPCNVAAKDVAVDKQQSVTGKSWEVCGLRHFPQLQSDFRCKGRPAAVPKTQGLVSQQQGDGQDNGKETQTELNRGFSKLENKYK